MYGFHSVKKHETSEQRQETDHEFDSVDADVDYQVDIARRLADTHMDSGHSGHGGQGAGVLQINPDQYNSIEEVSEAIRKEGLDTCSLIFGIDYTMSNRSQGQKTFEGRSLHAISDSFLNPYQRVMCILGETLESFDDDGIIPAFGFGDSKCKDKTVFNLKPEGVCEGFNDVLDAYTEITPTIKLGGPTNFAPLIEKAIEVVKETKEYHILVIVADGQVTNQGPTNKAIIEASHYPLSIIFVGVGDGPWGSMETFDDGLSDRLFDNFQFVDFHKVTHDSPNPQAAFALNALMEIPEQYKYLKEKGLLK